MKAVSKIINSAMSANSLMIQITNWKTPACKGQDTVM